MAGGDWRRILLEAVRAGLQAAARSGGGRTTGRSRRRQTTGRPRRAGRSRGVRIDYAPHLDGEPDPGEVVWTWVPYEEDPGQGKDRPVLVVGRDGGDLVALMLTSKDHDRDAADEARHGRVWMDLGTGAWDSRRRPSEVRLDRLLRLDPEAVRREGAVLDRVRFERVVARLREEQGWSAG